MSGLLTESVDAMRLLRPHAEYVDQLISSRIVDAEILNYSQHEQESHGGLPGHQTPSDPNVLLYQLSKAFEKP